MIKALHYAIAGLKLHERIFNAAAHNISRCGDFNPKSGEPPVDLARETVNTIIAKHGFRANLKTIETADEMIGTLLDTKS